jgi:hypothetical protein
MKIFDMARTPLLDIHEINIGKEERKKRTVELAQASRNKKINIWGSPT